MIILERLSHDIVGRGFQILYVPFSVMGRVMVSAKDIAGTFFGLVVA